MNLFKPSPVAERPSVLIQLRLVDKTGAPIDPHDAWKDLIALFKNHPHLQIFKAEFTPDKDYKTNV